MREGCCVCMGAKSEGHELQKTTENTYFSREPGSGVQGSGEGVLSRPTAEKVGNGGVNPKKRKSPRWEQRQRARRPRSRAKGLLHSWAWYP